MEIDTSMGNIGIIKKINPLFLLMCMISWLSLMYISMHRISLMLKQKKESLIIF